MGINSKVEADEADSLVNQTTNRANMGSLLYLKKSRLNIVFSIGMCADSNHVQGISSKGRKSDPEVLKKIGDLVLFYPIGDSFELVENEDGDFKWYQVDRKSISRITHFLGSSLIYWGTKKQNSIAL